MTDLINMHLKTARAYLALARSTNSLYYLWCARGQLVKAYKLKNKSLKQTETYNIKLVA